jgi:NADH dehydrogenase
MARVVLIEAGPRVLPTFSPASSDYARRALHKLGVEVRTGEAVELVEPDGVRVNGKPLPAGNVIWAAGVRASPAAAWLRADADRAGRVKVGPDLSLPDDPAVLVIGDAALVLEPDGRLVPGIAVAAKQEGTYVGKAIRARLDGRPPPAPFRYRSPGSLATIGRHAAVVEMKPLRLTGLLAWLVWCLAHVYFLIGFRNRILVSLEWLWAYFTFERGARLITAEPAEAAAPAA